MTKKHIRAAITIVLLIALIFAICGCSNSVKNAEETSADGTQSQTVSQQTQPNEQGSQSASSARIYYDRYGKEHSSYETLPLYDSDGNAYTFVKQSKNSYYKDKDGNKYPSRKCFVDKQSNFIYDKDGKITLSDDGMSATDKDNNTYYPAETVVWDIDGNLVTVFGFGEIIR